MGIIDLVLFYEYCIPAQKAKLERDLQDKINTFYSNLEKHTNKQKIQTEQ